MGMKRTKLSDRRLPDYTKGEELANMCTHIAGGVLGIVALILCVVKAASVRNIYGVVGCSIYGASLIMLYTVSSVYHGLFPSTAKKVMQVLDHCTIYFLIAGSYTPPALCAIRRVSPGGGWAIFGVVWGFCSIACVFTAIDLHKYKKLAMICYIGMGWCVVLAIRPVLASIAVPGIILLVSGGVAYTLGAVLYKLGDKMRWMHSVFHIFCIAGSALQFFCFYYYVI